jgi:threonine synthase
MHEIVLVILGIIAAIPATVGAYAALKVNRNVGVKNGQGGVAEMTGKILKNQVTVMEQVTAMALQLSDHISHHGGTPEALGDDTTLKRKEQGLG